MNGLFILLLILLLAILIGALAWRAASKRRAMPCPSWLAPLLENPYVNAVAGAEVLLDRARLEPGMKVLDVGAGPGRLTLPAAVRVGPAGKVVAIDLQEKMVEQLRERIATLGIKNVELRVADVGQSKLEESAFDRAFLVTVLGEILDPGQALQEIYAALKDGGILSITEVFPDPHYQNKRVVCRLAEEAGFRLHEDFGRWFAFTINFQKRSTP
jgi:ubiquinone/menaquinone biosynthesis C-methylase UbiE